MHKILIKQFILLIENSFNIEYKFANNTIMNPVNMKQTKSTIISFYSIKNNILSFIIHNSKLTFSIFTTISVIALDRLSPLNQR